MTIQEPPMNLEDTQPGGNRKDVAASAADRTQMYPWLNRVMLAATALITFLAAVLYLQSIGRPAKAASLLTHGSQTATAIPTISVTAQPTIAVDADDDDGEVPPDVIAALLSQPGDTAPPSDQLYRMESAYTIAPVRNRDALTTYRIRQGDTLDTIAKQFGLSKDTLVWDNDGIHVNRLLPGDTLTILPEDGVIHKTANGDSIQAIADLHKVSPYAILDSEYNKLQNASPQTLLPAGMQVMVPGGTSPKKAAYWDPGVAAKKAPFVTGGAGASVNPTGEVSFGGGAGACGYQPNVGGTGSLRRPVPSGYQITRGFSAFHGGIDLAMPAGTPVFAADSGTVIFAGWSDWGFGDTVVLAHGSMLTLYGHLSRISIGCGQRVSGGQVIGAIGSTGNSSGPHLHFVIRPGAGAPVDPVGYMAFLGTSDSAFYADRLLWIPVETDYAVIVIRSLLSEKRVRFIMNNQAQPICICICCSDYASARWRLAVPC